MASDGEYAATIDLRPGYASGQVWRHGRKLDAREALVVIEELRELLIDQLEVKPLAAAIVCHAPERVCQNEERCARRTSCAFESWAAYPSAPGAV